VSANLVGAHTELNDRILEHRNHKQQLFEERVKKIEEKQLKKEKKMRDVLKQEKEEFKYRHKKMNEKYESIM
jgi:hypothetical protein